MEVVVSRFPTLGDFDTLDRMLADAPNAAHAVLVPLPCGCRLVAGALGIVAGTMAGQRSPSIVEGLAGTFDPSGVMIGLGFGAARSTWDLIGAVADGTRDGRDLPGGLFWRADLWHRLGRMDPTLTYAGYLDFRSKAAVHAEVGRIEAVLVEDRRRALKGEDAGRQREEIVRVQMRAERRQARLSERIIDGGADAGGLGPPLAIAYDGGSRTWRRREAPGCLDSLGRAEIVSGFRDREGPYPEGGLPKRFRWTTGRRATFSVSAGRGRHRVALRLRNPSADQSVSVDLNGETLLTVRPETASLHDLVEVDLNCDFRQGRNEMALIAEVLMIDGAGQPLGVVVESVEIATVPA